jgi:hypothetical protein
VYGNADYEIDYNEAFGESSHHMHLKSLQIGEFTFAGMSGCAANWGRNPAALATYAEIDRRHRAILAAREEAEADFAKVRAEIDAAHATKAKQISLTAPDRRKRAFRERIARLEEKRDCLIGKAAKAKEEVKASAAYAAYLDERWRASPEIARLNRGELIGVIRDSGAAPERTIALTHERLYRMHEDAPGIMLYVFGHKHAFTNTTHRGSRFVTVGALHRPVSVVPEADPDEGWHNVHNINDGNYAIIELRGGAIEVTYVPFSPSFAGWRRSQDTYLGSTVPWVPS